MSKKTLRKKRQERVSRKIIGLSKRPRLAVYRSNKHIYAQVIDDEKKVTLVSSSDKKLSQGDQKKTKTEKASLVGMDLGKKLVKNKIKSIVFDRRGYKFHGRVKALAEAVRGEGIIF
ncbi:50S ribosomal protein L18 [Candidatus Dojkabacteria bacterium]|nr:50S ribosomal protein L18 [Candidatus Dojkabacteria bacterium]